MTSPARLIRRHRTAPTGAGRPLKIVVTGPFSAGKTTLIKTISEVAIVGTERDVSDHTRAVKQSTTVAMDFGRISFADGTSLFLFGTPGQRRFEMMWEILSEGMIGFLVLVRADDRRSVGEARHILDTFRRYADVPYVVGVSHLDKVETSEDDVLAEVRTDLGVPDGVPVVPCDPRARDAVKGLLLEILYGVLRRLEVAAAAGTE